MHIPPFNLGLSNFPDPVFCQKGEAQGRTAPFIFVSNDQWLYGPEISGFSKKLTPYIVVEVYIIYNILYLAPDDSNLMGFSKKLSVSA